MQCKNEEQLDCESEANLEATQAYYMCLQDCSDYPIGSIQYQKCEGECAELRDNTFEEEFNECVLIECGEDAFATSQMLPVGFVAQIILESGFGSIGCQGQSTVQINEQAGISQDGRITINVLDGNLLPLPLDECYISDLIDNQFFNSDCIGCVTVNYFILWADEDNIVDPDLSEICVEFGPVNFTICNG